MRGVWRRLGPRYGIGLGLILAISVIVLVARIGSHPTPDGLTVNGGAPAASVGSNAPDDGDPAIPSPQPPTASPGGKTAVQVAVAFSKAWLHHDGIAATSWRQAVTRDATDHLAAQFADVDPSSVPASRITGPITTTDHSASYVEIGVPTDQGTLVLGLLFMDGRWRVDSVDWDAT